MNKFILFIALTFGQGAWAADCQPLLWKSIQGNSQEICYFKEHGAYMSSSCAKGCAAQGLMKTAKSTVLPKSQEIGETGLSRNPGTVLCAAINGKVIIARNPRGSESAFCEANDGSWIDSSSLVEREH